MKARVTAALLILVSNVAVQAQQRAPFSGDRIATVVTRNVYQGVDAEIFAVPRASDSLDLLLKVAAVYNGYFLRDFPERAAAIAAEIEVTQPELIGLQEAIMVRTQDPADGPVTPATTVELDFVQILLDALADRGLQYEVVVQSIGLDVELPSALGIDVRHTDREVILARTDLKTADLKLSNAQVGNFVNTCTLPGEVVGPVPVTRGWVAVDAEIRGKIFRFLSTHLDGDCLGVTPFVQEAQAAELLAGPLATSLPVLLVGDLNTPADGGTTYNNLIAAGFGDAWTQVGVGDGLTCCQANDVLNPVSTLRRRIDFVLFRGDWTPTLAETLGDDPLDQTPSGLWPSDHAGVAAKLKLPHP